MQTTAFEIEGGPMYYWTDSKIRVHAFHCMLGIALLQYIARTAWAGLSMEQLVKELRQIQQFTSLFATGRKGAQLHPHGTIHVGWAIPQRHRGSQFQVLSVRRDPRGALRPVQLHQHQPPAHPFHGTSSHARTPAHPTWLAKPNGPNSEIRSAARG